MFNNNIQKLMKYFNLLMSIISILLVLILVLSSAYHSTNKQLKELRVEYVLLKKEKNELTKHMRFQKDKLLEQKVTIHRISEQRDILNDEVARLHNRGRNSFVNN